MTTIIMPYHFDFHAKTYFDARWSQEIASTEKELVLDFSKVHFLDGSGLGVLLLIRAKASESNVHVSMTHVREDIRVVLELARFDQLFIIKK